MSALDELAEEELVENPTLRAAYNLAPLHQNEPLHWDYEVDLIGEKIYDKVIHLCEICELPILVYGRMLPCKHIFCFECARKCDKSCRRCGNKVHKVEKSALGTVYVCSYGAPKHSTKGCRRTYLSQRDLQSHIGHRHLAKPSSSSSSGNKQTSSSSNSGGSTTVQPAPNQLPMTQQQAQAAQQLNQAPPSSRPGQALPQMSPGSSSSQIMIPGLGGLVVGQGSPHVTTSSVSPSPQLGMSSSYSGGGGQLQGSSSADIYMPFVDMGQAAMQQQQRHVNQPPPQQHQQQQVILLQQPPQQQQLVQGMPQQGAPQGMPPPQHHLQQPVVHYAGQQGHFQQQQMVVSQDNMMAPSNLPPNTVIRQHPQPPSMSQAPTMHQQIVSSPGVVPVSLPMASLGAGGTADLSSHSRTNINLITVPIQDIEGQYRPQPFINAHPMMSQPPPQVSSYNTQTGLNNPGAPPPFQQTTHMQPGFPVSAHSNILLQGDSQGNVPSFSQPPMSSSPQGSFNPGVRPPQPTIQGMSYSNSNNSFASGGVGVQQQQANNNQMQFSHHQHQGPSHGGPNNNHGAFNSHQGGMQHVPPRMSSDVSGGSSSNNIRPNLATVVQQINRGGMRAQGPPPPRGPPGGARFPPGRWPRPPRMHQHRPPPRQHDNSYNQGPYYK